MDKKVLLLLENEMKRDPSIIGDILGLCMQHWQLYLQSVEQQRDSLAKNAIDGLIAVILTKKPINKMLPFIIDAIKYNFPNGYSHPHSYNTEKFLTDFIKACKEHGYNPEDDFIKETREFSENLKILYKQYENKQSSLLNT